MSQLEVVRDEVWEDSGPTFMARVKGNDGAYITQASLTAITWKVYDSDSATPNTAIANGTCTVASSVFDTLQTGDPWSKDSTGYNFKYTMAATSVPTGGHNYVVEFSFDPKTGDDFPVVYYVSVRRLRSS